MIECSQCHKLKTAQDFSKGRRQCRSCVRIYQKQANSEWRLMNSERRMSLDLKRAFGIDYAQFLALLAKQGGGCAICGSHEPGGRGRFHVDHDHETGKIRGILCALCNMALGLMNDSAERLRLAAGYLERNHGSC